MLSEVIKTKADTSEKIESFCVTDIKNGVTSRSNEVLNIFPRNQMRESYENLYLIYHIQLVSMEKKN